MDRQEREKHDKMKRRLVGVEKCRKFLGFSGFSTAERLGVHYHTFRTWVRGNNVTVGKAALPILARSVPILERECRNSAMILIDTEPYAFVPHDDEYAYEAAIAFSEGGFKISDFFSAPLRPISEFESEEVARKRGREEAVRVMNKRVAFLKGTK